MANRAFNTVNYNYQKGVVQLSARLLWDASGNVSLDPNNSAGFAKVAPETIAFSAFTTTSSSSLGTVSSFAGLVAGMAVTGSTGALQGSTVIGSSGSLALTINKFPLVSSGPVNLFASTGRIRLQFGTSATSFDTYNRIMGYDINWDDTTASSVGTATQVQLVPIAPVGTLMQNNIAIRTVPPTNATCASTDASVALQFGNYTANGFTAGNPNAGEACWVTFYLSNSTAR